jgi:hypothetical protein
MPQITNRLKNKILIAINEHSKKGAYRLEDIFIEDVKNII